MLFDDLPQRLSDSRECLGHPQASVDSLEHPRTDSAVYPVLALPPEITCEIFLQCVESEDTTQLSSVSAPLLLLQICRSWRLIALAAPPLWSCAGLTSTLGFSKDDRWHHRLQSIPGPHPSLWDQLAVFTAKELSIADILHVLSACPRLRKISIRGTNLAEELPPSMPPLVHAVLAELHLFGVISRVVRLLALPALRVLSLECILRNEPDFPPFLARCAASLREFRVQQVPDVDPDRLALAWFRILENLDTVTLQDPAPQLSPFLCALDRKVDPGFLPRLRRLRITDRSHTVDAPVVRALQSRATDTNDGAAKLESLRLCVMRNDYDPPHYDPPLHWSEVGPVDWDALWDLGKDGMDIHVGSQDENLLYEWWDWESE